MLDTWRQIPLFAYHTFDEMLAAQPYDCPLVGIETDGAPLPEFAHPPRAVYLLGAEDGGLPNHVKRRCQQLVSIPAARTASYKRCPGGDIGDV